MNGSEHINGVHFSVFEDYEEVRKSGKCNMFDMKCVLKTCDELQLYDLIDYIFEGLDKEKYGYYGYPNPFPECVRERYSKILKNYDKWKKSRNMY